MQIWEILGIEETKDKRRITRAYRDRLMSVNPEEKPEEFKQLRAAYEEALRLAELDEPAAAEKSPVDLWTERLDVIYKDLRKRRDPEEWKALFGEEVCARLDTKALAEEAMLKYFMHSFHLPQEIWLLINDRFSFLDRLEELYEIWPRDFVDYVIVNGVRYEPSLPYAMFTPGTDGTEVDHYYALYHKMRDTNLEETEEVREELLSLKEQHPYGTSYAARIRIRLGKTDAIGILEQMAGAYPEDVHLTMDLAAEYGYLERYEEALELGLRMKDKEPENPQILRLVADAYAGVGQYKEATDTINEIMKHNGGDQMLLYQLDEVRKGWNEKLIVQYRDRLEEDPQDSKTRLDYAWCCLQNDLLEEADEAIALLKEEDLTPFDYYNIFASVKATKGDHETAYGYMEKLVEIVREMKPDGTKKTDERIGRLAEMLQRLAVLDLQRKDIAMAKARLQESLERNPEDPETLTNAVRLYCSMREYRRASDTADLLIKVLPDSYHSYLMKAVACTELHEDAEAFRMVNESLEMNGGDLTSYLLKLRILVRNLVFDQAEEMLDFLHRNGIEDEATMLWMRGRILRDRDHDAEQALEYYRKAEKMLEEESPLWYTQFYYEMALLVASVNDQKKVYDRTELIALLDQGLSKDPENYNCLDYKAWLLAKDRRNEEAITIYHELEKRDRRDHDVERQLGYLYFRSLRKDADKALHYFREAAKDNAEDAELQYYIGMCCFRMNRIEEAEEAFRKEQQLDPADIDSWYRLAYLYLYTGRYEEALVQAEQTIVLAKEREADTTYFWEPKILVLRRTGRWQEAVDAVRESQEANPDHGGFNRKVFTILLEAGRFEEASALMKGWKKRKGEYSDHEESLVELHLAQGHYKRARFYLLDRAEMIEQNAREQLEAVLRLANGKRNGFADSWARRVKEQREQGNDMDYCLMQYAVSLWFEGKTEEAKTVAEEALQCCEASLKEFGNSRPLYLTRKAELLAVLGRFAEARELLEEAKKLPLCETCEYCACKDAWLIESTVEIMAGHPDHARLALLMQKKTVAYEAEAIRNEVYLKMMKGEKKC